MSRQVCITMQESDFLLLEKMSSDKHERRSVLAAQLLHQAMHNPVPYNAKEELVKLTVQNEEQVKQIELLNEQLNFMRLSFSELTNITKLLEPPKTLTQKPSFFSRLTKRS